MEVAIAEIVEVLATAGRYTEKLKDAEREIQQINTGLNSLQNALQGEGLRLAEVLQQAIIAFEEAKRSNNRIWNIFKRRS